MPHVEFINPAQAEDNIATLKIDDQIYSLEQVIADPDLSISAIGDFYPTTPFNSTSLHVDLTKNPKQIAKNIFADDQLKEITYTDSSKFIVLDGSFLTDTVLNITFISPFGVILSNATFTNFEVVNILSPTGVVCIYNCMAANLTMDSSSILLLGEVATFNVIVNTKHFIEKGSIIANSLRIEILTEIDINTLLTISIGSVSILGKILTQNDINILLYESTIHIAPQASIESTQGFIKIKNAANFTNDISLKGKAGIEISTTSDSYLVNNKEISTYGLLTLKTGDFNNYGNINADFLVIELKKMFSHINMVGSVRVVKDAKLIFDNFTLNPNVIFIVGGLLEIIDTNIKDQRSYFNLIKAHSLKISVLNTLLIDKQTEIKAESKIEIEAISFINRGLVKANDAVIIITKDEITVSGTIQSLGEMEIKGTNLVLNSGAKIEAIKTLELKIESVLLKSGSLIQSYGSLLIESRDSNLFISLQSKSLIIESAEIKVTGNATIKVQELVNKRSGGYSIGRTDIHKWGYDCPKHKWGMKGHCYKDDWGSTLQPEGLFYIGGNLVFEGLKIENTISLFVVIRDLFVNKKPEIKSQNVELKTYANYKSWIDKSQYHNWAVGGTRNELAKCGLNNYGQMNGHDQKVHLKMPSTFAVLGLIHGEFTGLLSSAISRNIDNRLNLLPPDMKQIDFTEISQKDFYLPSTLKIDEVLVQVYNPLSKQGSIINPQMKITEESDASFAPFLSYYHPPLIPCEYGTSELLQTLGVDKTKYPQIFASADIEKSLIEHGMFELTGVNWLSVQAEKLLAISYFADNIDMPEDKGCTQLKLLLNNGLKIKEQYKLETGKSLSDHHLKDISLPFVWPVTRTLDRGKEVLVLELYLPEDVVRNAPARYGSAMIFGSIDIKVDTFISTGLFAVNDGAKISATNIGLAGRFVVNNGDAKLSAVYNIVNVGSIQVNGNLNLSAGHDIIELIMINPANPVPELTKRAVYAIDGNLYYRADHDITQQASVIFASGDVVMNAGNNINIESVHQSRVIKEERSKKHYLIQSTIDQYDAIIMVNGKIEMTAGNNFIGSGVKLAASTGDVSIKAGEKATLEDKTGYAWNHRGATKKKLLGKSKVSVSWTTHETAQIEITAPGGTVYVSSKECSLEGGRIDGKVPMFRCDKLQIKAHEVTSQIEMRSSKTGFISHSFPLGDLLSSKDPVGNLRDNTIAGQIKSLKNMQGPLDLLPAVNVISTIPNLVADYNFLKGNQTTFSPEALVGALLSKYISASISFGNKKTTTLVTQSISTLSEVTGEQCSFSGNNLDIAANVKCQSIDLVANVDCKLHGSKSTIKTESTMKSSTFDVGVGLSGVSFTVSIGDGKAEQSQDQHQAGIYQATNISIKVNNKLEIENAQINGINVKVEALIIEIKQVVDSSMSKSQSTGVSMGVNIGWGGEITPILSVSNSESLQQSQVVQLISGISGETVEVTANTLVSNIAAIEATQDLKVKADSINYIALPTVENIDTETQVTVSVSPRADGKSVYYGSLYNRDGDKVMSIGWSSNLMEGIQDIRKGIESVLGSNSNDNQQGLKATDQTNEQDKDNTDTNTNEEQDDSTKKEKKTKAQLESEQSAVSTNQNSKGQIVYDEAIGPNEPFIDDYKKVAERIDAMPLSDTEKLYYKENAYRVIKKLYSMSHNERVELANDIEDQSSDRSVSDKIWNEVKKLNPLYSADAHGSALDAKESLSKTTSKSIDKIVEYQLKLKPYNIKVSKKISMSKKELQEANSLVLDYYNYLANTGILYSYAAKDVATNNGAFGRFANNYLHDRAIKEGKSEEQIINIQNNIRISLAYQDAYYRIQEKNTNIPYKDIADYHYKIFENQGLSKYAWGGVFFEEFAGSGSWMDFGGYDTQVDIEQFKAFSALLNNEIVGNIEARTAFNYLLESVASQKADVIKVLGTRSLEEIADAALPFVYAMPTYERYMIYLNENKNMNKQ